jgi:hypothetical protein
MPRKTDDTTVNEAPQATPSVADDWATEVVTRLPGNVQHQASVLKAFERSRQIRSATDLLRGLLAYVYTMHSFQHLSIWSLLVGVADVSATDWRKRLQRASAWLSWLLQEVLAVSTAASPWLVRGGWRRILLIDGTHWKCPGAQGMVWRVHTAFDLLAGRLTQLKVTDQQEGEHLEVFDLQAGDLVITDRANGLRQRIVFVLRKAADLVVRFTPHNLPLQEASGKALDVVRWRVWMSCPGRTSGVPGGLDQLPRAAVRRALYRVATERRATQGGEAPQKTHREQETAAGAGGHVVSGRMAAADHNPAKPALECAAGAVFVSSALAHRAGRRSASNSC